MAATPSPAPPGGVPPQRATFATTDPDEARDFIVRMWNARPPQAGRRPGRLSPVAISQVSAGGLSYADFALPPDVTLHVTGTDDLSVTTVLAGAAQAELGRGTERYAAGDVCLGSFPRADYLVRYLEYRAAVLTVPAAALTRAAGALPGHPGPELRFGSLRPATAAAARRWKGVAAYVQGILEDDEAAASPLILGSAARLLAATALAVFPHDRLPAPARKDRTDAHPDTLRRAVTFIDENAHTDIGISDVAAAAAVTPRAVQLAFRRHLGLTPLAYLRHVRLDHAHRDLVAADPEQETVTAVAFRWGFASTSRFAAYYRLAFGSAPSRTLGKGRDRPR